MSMSENDSRIIRATYRNLPDELNSQAKRHTKKSFVMFCMGGGVLVLAATYYGIFVQEDSSLNSTRLVPAALFVLASIVFIMIGAYYAHRDNQANKRREIIIISDENPGELLDRLYRRPDSPLICISEDNVKGTTAMGKSIADKGIKRWMGS